MGDPSRDARPSTKLPAWAHVLDGLTIAAWTLAAALAVRGGTVLYWSGIRISLRSGWRPLAWGIAFALLRHVLVRRPAIHQSIVGAILAGARGPGVLPDDVTLLRRRGLETAPPERRTARLVAYRPRRAAAVRRADVRSDLPTGAADARREHRHRRSAVFHLAHVVVRPPAPTRSASSVRRQHLLPRTSHAGVLGRNARPIVDGSAADLGGCPSAHGVQRPAAFCIRTVGCSDVSASSAR